VAVVAAVAATAVWASIARPDAAEPLSDQSAAAPPAVATGLRAGLTEAVSTPVGDGLVQWSVSWELTWEPVPGAAEYVVHAVGPEGAASDPMRTVTAPVLRLTVAAGTTSEADRETAMRAQAAYRATQLGVTVAAVSADGEVGPRTNVIPVGSRLDSP
jgi:hypothetical protein